MESFVFVLIAGLLAAENTSFRLLSIVDGNWKLLFVVVDGFVCLKRSLLAAEKEFTSWLNRIANKTRNIADCFILISAVDKENRI